MVLVRVPDRVVVEDDVAVVCVSVEEVEVVIVRVLLVKVWDVLDDAVRLVVVVMIVVVVGQPFCSFLGCC